MIRHAGASAVLPFLGGLFDPDPDVLLVRQYRYASDGYLYEIPAGLPAGPQESWEECAHRELEEETGMRAATMTPLTRIYTTPDYTGLYGRGDPALCRDGSGAGGTLERPGRIHGSSAGRFLGGAGNGPGRTDRGRQKRRDHPLCGSVCAGRSWWARTARAGGCVPRLRSIVPKVGRKGSAEQAEIGYFGLWRSGTVRAMPVRQDGWVLRRRGVET